MNAVAVCPDGNELLVEPSGRGERTVYFSPFTTPPITAHDMACAVSMRPHELLLFTPIAFMPYMATAGTYCNRLSAPCLKWGA